MEEIRREVEEGANKTFKDNYGDTPWGLYGYVTIMTIRDILEDNKVLEMYFELYHYHKNKELESV